MHKPKPKPKPQSNWRLSDTAREILRTIAEMDRRSQAASLEIILEEEAARRGLVPFATSRPHATQKNSGK